MMNVATFHYQVVALAVAALQLWRRNFILSFISQLKQLYDNLNHSLKSCFHKVVVKNFLIVVTLTIYFFLMQMPYFKVFVVTVVANGIAVYPYLVMLSFLGFVKTIEAFLVLLMRDFRNQLEESLPRVYLDFQKQQQLMINYQTIHDLSESFNKIFGLQMSAMTFCITTMTILDVILNK